MVLTSCRFGQHTAAQQRPFVRRALRFLETTPDSRRAALPSVVNLATVRGVLRTNVLSIAISPCVSSFVRCSDKLLVDKPVSDCRYLKSASAQTSRIMRIASRAGSRTTRSMFTTSLNGSDISLPFSAVPGHQPLPRDGQADV